MSGTHLQCHLVIGAEIDRLDVSPRPQIPEVDPMAILVGEEILRHDPVLELRWQCPLACHHVIAWQVPPEVIVQGLRTTIDLPTSQDLECLAVHDEDAGRSIGTILAAATESADVDTFGPAVDRVRPRVTGLPEDLLRLDDFVNLGLGRIRFDVDDVNPRGPHARNDKVAALEECVPGEWRQGGRASVPSEMVKLVALVGHRHRVHDLAERRRASSDVDHGKGIGFGKIWAK